MNSIAMFRAALLGLAVTTLGGLSATARALVSGPIKLVEVAMPA